MPAWAAELQCARHVAPLPRPRRRRIGRDFDESRLSKRLKGRQLHLLNMVVVLNMNTIYIYILYIYIYCIYIYLCVIYIYICDIYIYYIYMWYIICVHFVDQETESRCFFVWLICSMNTVATDWTIGWFTRKGFMRVFFSIDLHLQSIFPLTFILCNCSQW